MRTLTVLSCKGGTGKTTLALHLAVAAARSGLNPLLGDMDPQRSASDWRRERRTPQPQVSELRPGALFTAHQAAQRAGHGLLILDTRPAIDQAASEAVRFSDLCLLVVRPSYFDLKAIERSVELVTNMGRRGMFVMNQAPHRRAGEEPRAIQAMVETLHGMGLPLARVGLRYRAAYQASVKFGLTAQEAVPDSPAAFEVNLLWRQVKKELWPAAAKPRPGRIPEMFVPTL